MAGGQINNRASSTAEAEEQNYAMLDEPAMAA